MKLKDKKAIITGASQGIGKGIALAFANAGADLVLHYCHSEEKINELAKQIESHGNQVILLKSDFSINNAPKTFMEHAIEKLGSVDILVNCAAAYEQGPLLEVEDSAFTLMQKVNVEVPFILSRLFAKHRIAEGGNGVIINVSSISDSMPSVGSCLNSCSKAALNMLTRSCALELAPYNIRVNGIAPGITETESNQVAIADETSWNKKISQEVPLGRAGLPEDMGALAVMLASSDASFITGITIPCDGGMTISWK